MKQLYITASQFASPEDLIADAILDPDDPVFSDTATAIDAAVDNNLIDTWAIQQNQRLS